MWYLQLCSSFLRLLWWWRIFCGSVQIFRIVFSISVENAIGILIGIAPNLYRSLWVVLTFHNINSLIHEKGYLLQYSGLENSMDCIVHGVSKSWTWLKDFHFNPWSLDIFSFRICVFSNFFHQLLVNFSTELFYLLGYI